LALRRIAGQGSDTYAFAAPLVCEAIESILDGKVAECRVRSPGATFHARRYLDALTPHHLTLEVAGA
jgi:hypothetical protein